MKRHRVTPGLVLFLCLALSRVCWSQPQTVADLEQLLAADLPAGIAHAEPFFDRAMAAEDLGTMVATLRATWDATGLYAACPGVVARMARETISLARERADLNAVADAYESWYGAARRETVYTTPWFDPVLLKRAARVRELRDEAAAKVGRELPPTTTPPEPDDDLLSQGLIAALPADLGALVTSSVEALVDLRDAEALAAASSLLRGVMQRHAALPVQTQIDTIAFASRFFCLRASEPLVRLAREMREGIPAAELARVRVTVRSGAWGESVPISLWMSGNLLLGWRGRDDVYREELEWSLDHWLQHPSPNTAIQSNTFCYAQMKMMALGLHGMASEWAARALVTVEQLGPTEQARFFYHGGCLVGPYTPVGIRNAVMVRCLTCHAIDEVVDWRANAYWVRRVLPVAEEQPWWKVDLGHMLLEASAQAADTTKQMDMVEEAARLFDEAGAPGLAAEARLWSEWIATQDVGTSCRLPLIRARAAAAAMRWEYVTEVLEPVFAGQPASPEGVEAAVLLTHAWLNLGDREKAGEWFRKASTDIDQAGLPAGERVGHLMSLAWLAEDTDWKARLLERAREAAAASGLDMLQDSVDEQLADVAIQAGRLGSARSALIDLIDRAEARRERLAFDPLLRQQWFADNITPYRQLMRVAALQGDAELALACGERMRARALLDQLAWKKTDLQINLAPEVAARLTELREMRRRAYALLAQVMGGGDSADDLRGLYMPIRGLYMPIRGPLDAGGPVTDEDVARLQVLLDALAAEEAALEGAIREQVPAYAMAAQAQIPTGDALVAEVARHPGLAVLHYTFADQGLAVTAIGADGSARVRMIEQDGNALYEQIGRFREAIWERSDDAITQAADLYQTLVRPVEGTLSGAERLWIVADGALQLVPFAALIDGRNQYLGARFPIAFAPSLTLALSSRGARPAPSRSAVIVAAPDTGAPEPAAEDDDDRGLYMPIRGMYMPVRGMYMPIRGEGVSSALTAMAMVPLPGAAAEGAAIAGQVPGAELVTGSDATKARLAELGGDCGMLHIATHGYADPDYPDFSGLLLAAPEGSELPYEVLTAMEVYTWPLDARLVTLSACQTALGRDVEGEGILGLSRAFIYAGAQDVVCSLWPVSDESTKTLMTAFYEALADGASVEEALQAGQNALPQSGDKAHPFYWAGFIAVRGPG